MTFPELLRWQWSLYPDGHRNRTNLLIHIVAVPAFLAALLLLIYGLVALSPDEFFLGALGIALSIMAQGRGHRLEAVPPVPFDGPRHFVARILAEQWITFPRFVLSGGWSENLRKAQSP